MANGSNNIAVTLYYVDTRDRDSDRVKDSCKYIMQPSINVLCVCNAYPAHMQAKLHSIGLQSFGQQTFAINQI